MTKIPHDDILEGLYKLRIRESDKLKTVLELYDLETQKKLGPDFHRLKTMVKRSTEQEIRNKNFGARSGNLEKNAVVKNQGTKQPLKELAITHSVKDGILQNACSTETRMVAVLVKSAHWHIVRLTHSRRNGQNRIMTKALWLYWKRVIGMNEDLLPTDITIDQGNLIRGVIKSWDKNLLNVSYLMHDNWVAYFRTWRRRSLFSGRALTCRKRSSV